MTPFWRLVWRTWVFRVMRLHVMPETGQFLNKAGDEVPDYVIVAGFLLCGVPTLAVLGLIFAELARWLW